MTAPPATHRRELAEWLAVTVLIVVVASATALYSGLWRLDTGLYDISLGLRGRPAADDIVIIGINDESLAGLGRWPWRRTVHAALIERLTTAGAGPILCDLVLTEADHSNPGDDGALARALTAHGRVALPVLEELQAGGERIEVPPIPPLAEAAAALGHIDRLTDADGIVRRTELWQRHGPIARPHLALALLGLVDPERYRRLTANADPTPILVPYAGPPGHYRHYAYQDVLLGKVAASALRGKVIFLGATATGLSDNVPTPVSFTHFDMPGVEIHATLFDALRQDLRLAQAPPLLAAVLTGTSLLLLLILLRLSSPHQGLLLVGAHGLLWIVIPFALLVGGGLWLPPAAALAGSVFAYPLWSWRRLVSAQVYMAREIDVLAREPGIVSRHPPSGTASADPFARQLANIHGAIDQLRDSRRFVRDVIDGLPVGVMVSAADGQILLANAKLAEIFALPPGDALAGRPLAPLLAALRWPAAFDPRQWLDGARPLPVHAHTDHGRHVLACVARCHFGADAAPGYLLTFDDTTELRQAELAREQALQFLSHDLRAPLASILTLLAGAPPPDLTDRIAGHTQAALDMADDFTQLARAEALDRDRFGEVDLIGTVCEAIDDAWARAQAKEIRIAMDTDLDEAVVRGDRSLLRRAVFNLIDNGVRYSPGGTRVTVRLDGDDDHWCLTVSDQGYGIAAADLPRLFHRFVRVSLPDQPPSLGSGLGLAMVKATVEGHGGHVAARSAPGSGSRFTIRLPRA